MVTNAFVQLRGSGEEIFSTRREFYFSRAPIAGEIITIEDKKAGTKRHYKVELVQHWPQRNNKAGTAPNDIAEDVEIFATEVPALVIDGKEVLFT